MDKYKKIIMSKEYRQSVEVKAKEHILAVVQEMDPHEVSGLFADVGALIEYSKNVEKFFYALGVKLQKDYPEEMSLEE